MKACDTSALFERAILLQGEFDALANAHERASNQQTARRGRMLGFLREHDEALSRLVLNGSTIPAAERAELSEHAMDLGRDFDKEAVAYVAALHRQSDDWRALRDIFAEFIKTRGRLRELGAAAPELIERTDYERRLEPHAFAAAQEPANPAQN